MPNTSISFPANPAVNQQYIYGTTTYVWTGTSWMTYIDSPSLIPINSSFVSYSPAAVGAVTRNAANKFNDIISVKDFGAVGNGSTNDTTAFNAAWTSQTPNPVLVPPGNYLITGIVTGEFYTFGTVTIVGGTVNTINRFTGAMQLDGSTFVVDAANNRVGINTSIPTQALSVTGNAAVSGNATVGGILATTGNATVGGNETIIGDLAVNGGDITTVATTATVFNSAATTLNIGGAATTVNLGAAAGTVSVGKLSMNAGYGSIAPVFGCRAWCSFSTANGTFAGGTATATRTNGSTTCTITTQNPHGLITNNYVRTTGTVLDSTSGGRPYEVTVTGLHTFTVTTIATSALSSVGVAFGTLTVVAGGNVSSVVRALSPNGVTNSNGNYYVNFSTAMPDANFATCVSGRSETSTALGAESTNLETRGQGIGHVRVLSCNFTGTANTDPTRVNVVVFR